MKSTMAEKPAVFVIKMDHDEDFIKALEAFTKKNKIKAGYFTFLGALKDGRLVAGPQKPVVPPVPCWRNFRGAWEAFGTGSVFSGKDGKPRIHIHASLGKKGRTITGCIRDRAKVFLMAEVFFYELKGVKAVKVHDDKTGLNLLKIS